MLVLLKVKQFTKWYLYLYLYLFLVCVSLAIRGTRNWRVNEARTGFGRSSEVYFSFFFIENKMQLSNGTTFSLNRRMFSENFTVAFQFFPFDSMSQIGCECCCCWQLAVPRERCNKVHTTFAIGMVCQLLFINSITRAYKQNKNCCSDENVNFCFLR